MKIYAGWSAMFQHIVLFETRHLRFIRLREDRPFCDDARQFITFRRYLHVS